MICSKSSVTEHAHEPDPDPTCRRPTRAIAPKRSPSASCPPSSGAGAAPRPTRPAVSSFRSARLSTTAGRARRRPSRSRPKSRGKSPRRSSPATNRPTSGSTARSIPIAAASTAASIATRGRPTPIWGSRPGSISKPGCSPRSARRSLLERELASPKYRPAPIAFGANTDPYQPIERQYRITRSLIETLARARHPLTIVTKSNLVLRDLDLLAPMARDGSGQGLRLGDHARPRRSRAGWSRARRRREAARGDRGAQRGGRAGGRDGRADHPGDQRRGAGDDPDPRLFGGRARGRLCRAEAAGRIARHVPRMAAGPLPRPAQARGVAHAVDARGQGLRGPVGPAHGRARAPTPG